MADLCDKMLSESTIRILVVFPMSFAGLLEELLTSSRIGCLTVD